MKRKVCTTLALLICLAQVRCASLSSALAINPKPPSSKITSPFSDYHPGKGSEISKNMILRTKKGDRTIELEIPGDPQSMSEFVLPLSPAFSGSSRGNLRENTRANAQENERDGERNGERDGERHPASATDAAGMLDESYKNRAPSFSDREILRASPQGLPADDQKRREIEESLRLSPSEEGIPTASSSYLGGIDHIKQLHRLARFEVALVETDEMIRQYPTDATLYKMRGTLLDSLGKRDLALQSWNQSLRFDPKNTGLKRFIDRKRSSGSAAGAP